MITTLFFFFYNIHVFSIFRLKVRSTTSQELTRSALMHEQMREAALDLFFHMTPLSRNRPNTYEGELFNTGTSYLAIELQLQVWRLLSTEGKGLSGNSPH